MALMRLLVLGGSWFYGRAVVELALDKGWDVTTFRRGVSGQDADGIQAIRGDRTNPADLARLAGAGPWDAVLDTSGYVPADVLRVATALQPVSDRYLLASTVSVYRDWPAQPVDERSPLKDCEPDRESVNGSAGDPGPALYGVFKAGCERAVVSVFGEDRSVLLRSHVMLGPREYVGRTAWWISRMRRGGQVLCPGDPARPIQPVDVRDAAAFTLLTMTGPAGAFNVAGTAHDTMADYLGACRGAAGSDAELVWADDDFLFGHGVGQWVELPLWRPQSGTWAMDTTAARAAGLAVRPVAETVADTAAWLGSAEGEVDHFRAGKLGIAAEKEAVVLAAWTADQHR
jgi:nucleoside-diphosphate-sugar epimerase